MKYVMMAFVLMGVSGAAMAQERQVYDPSIDYIIPIPMQQSAQPVYVPPPAYRVYPGRENYGDNFGHIPRHPGDYRDAVDRGQWSAGEPHYNTSGPHLFYDQ